MTIASCVYQSVITETDSFYVWQKHCFTSCWLGQIKPCAVIIEEAAGILEGQLVSVLPPSIQHLVMLGDQEQLKPSVTCYELKRYKNLDCSMFERLINNNLDHQQLGKQFRMRDDIAQLLRELKIYKVLGTDPKVNITN